MKTFPFSREREELLFCPQYWELLQGFYTMYEILAQLTKKQCWDIFFALEIQKVLIKLSKEHGCEIVGKWRKACVRHYYWSVTSTPIKMGEVIIAKFHSFLYHILNKHKDLPNPLFKECAHRENIRPKVWFTKSKL